MGFEAERVRVEWISGSEGQRVAEVTTEFTEQLKKLGPNPLKQKS